MRGGRTSCGRPDTTTSVRAAPPVVTDPEPQTPAPPDPAQLLRSRSYLVLLVLGALIGVPVATVAYFFLEAVSKAQEYVFATLPDELGFSSQPAWWPIPFLALSGLLVALSIQYLPGTSGHKPAEGFKASGPVQPIELPGIVIASFATLSLGVVLGPEAPLIAIGSGLGVLAMHLVKRDAPQTATVVLGATGSFAAISTLLGSPLAAAFLLMEVAGVGGALMGVVLVPGLLAAGIGSLIYVGLDDWTGLGTFSLAVPDIPAVGSPTGAEFLWAIVIGLLAAIVGACIRTIALRLQPIVEHRRLILTPLAGVAIGVLVLVFVEATDTVVGVCPVLGPESARAADRGCRGVDGRRTAPPRRLQGVRLCHRPERVSRWPGLPRHVHRRRRWNRPLASPRAADGRRRGHGHRGDDRRHARTAARLGPARAGVPAGRRAGADATCDRRGRRVLRRIGSPHAPTRADTTRGGIPRMIATNCPGVAQQRAAVGTGTR